MNLKSVKAVLLGFSAVLLIFIFLLVSNNFYRAIRISEKGNTLIHCLDRTSSLLEILRNLQIYRGLSGFYLNNGDKSVAFKLLELRKVILSEYNKVIRSCPNRKLSLLLKKNMDDFRDLSKSAFSGKKNPEEVFSEFSLIIDDLLNILAVKSNEYLFNNIEDLKIKLISEIAIQRIPRFAEVLGRIRGQLVLLLTESNGDLKLKKSIFDNIKIAYGYLDILNWSLKNIGLDKDIEKQVRKVSERLDNVISESEDILFEGIGNKSVSEIFNDQTQSIDLLYKLDANLIAYLKSLLNLNLNRKVNNYLMLSFIYLCIFILLNLLIFKFYRKFYYSNKQIIEALESIKRGNFDLILKKTGIEEFDKVAEIFNSVIKELKRNLNYLKGYWNAINETNPAIKLNPEGKVIYVNEKFKALLGYKEELLGKRVIDLFSSSNDERELRKFEEALKERESWNGILKVRTRNGDTKTLIANLSPIFDEKGEIFEFLLLIQDITEIEKSRERIYKLYYFDRLTQLPNREKLAEDLGKYKRPALLIIDIIEFGKINKVLGIECGDKILCDLSKKLVNMVPNGSVYRISSDAFAIVLDFEDFKENIQILTSWTREFLKSLEKEEFSCENLSISLSFRAGLSISKVSNLLVTAEEALKRAKKERKKLFVYTRSKEEEREKFLREIRLVKEIKDAIDSNRVIPYYQPIVNNSTEKIEKLEALARLLKKDGSIMNPGEFLEISKFIGIYPEITRQIFEKVIRDLEEIPFEVSINLSYEDLTAETTFNSIVNFLRNLKPKKGLQVEFTNRLVFEIVETEDIENYKYLQRFVKLVKPLGCKLAIDDFGAGYSNLKRIIDFKVDYLKIDGSIIKSVKTDKNSISLIKSIVSFSKALGIKTIAEFVSDEEIFKIVKDLGVDYSQGYYFGKPESKDEILRKYVT
ncbi:PAS domain S-box-containing protein/diguanylate cyclase (GGDEF) domain-containing protein [Balnearium lithotrophicum]|uniref:PAS domain S-box-containing protein/diguanylate cyclase (GGDEF) domain-containing protein n=1 Tax=Balnearium lithotrophicum TaxID=223788 RepID=A0A521AE06_9BACT|nr:EAL domain-containing protein [Balnearium lithotrophicum]SMO33042.1 PAS domain S-box-containing protein/diguanylate cyclase (GGDEF) domain-containing protein [Balnearium lithotrophicum]